MIHIAIQTLKVIIKVNDLVRSCGMGCGAEKADYLFSILTKDTQQAGRNIRANSSTMNLPNEALTEGIPHRFHATMT